MSTRRLQKAWAGAALLAASLSFSACTRSADTPSKAAVRDDMDDLTKAAKKTGQDIGHATTELADKAGERMKTAANEAGEAGSDAWLTTKVKSALTAGGLDPLQVHVDTANHVVTLSGSAPTSADVSKAVTLAKTVQGVAAVENHLFVKPGR